MNKLSGMLSGILLVLCLTTAAFSATYRVTKTADTNDGVCDADCSLREAIAAAAATADNDEVVFSAGVFSAPQVITLTGGEIVIAGGGSLTVNGTGMKNLTISGNNATRLFGINTGGTVSLNNLTLTGGNGAGAANTGRGGALYNNGGVTTLTNVRITGNTGANGGGTNNANSGNLTFIGCEISNNTASGAGGGMQNFSGTTLTMINTTVSGNTSNSTLTGGGGIQANGTLSFTNTTFSGNRAPSGDGGGLYYNGQGLTMTNTTVVNNTATDGGGLYKSTSVANAVIRNTLIAGNTAPANADIRGDFSSAGNNLIGTVGSSTGWTTSDILGQAALTAPLGNYGGTGMTHALLSGSPAINAGQNCVIDLSCASNNPPVAVVSDQRGAGRSTATVIDIGAFEVSNTYVAVLPFARVNQPYSETIAPDNMSFAYALSGGGLPPGVSLTTSYAGGKGEDVPAATVALSGTPTQTGTYNFAVTVGNGMNSTVVNYRLPVVTTAASVSIGGRVTDAAGNTVRNARVLVTDASGVTRASRTNSFGRYFFEAVTPGENARFDVFAKTAQFQTQTVFIVDTTADLNFTAQP